MNLINSSYKNQFPKSRINYVNFQTLFFILLILLIPVFSNAGIFSNLENKELSSFDSTLPVATVFVFQASCTNNIPNNDGYFQVSSLENGDRVNWVTGSDYSGGDVDYVNAMTIGTLPFQFAPGLPNPIVSQDYTIRIFNGASNCFTDIVVTMNTQDCIIGCVCEENLYLNDTGFGEVHKFSINPADGVITEIGSPWMSGFSNPHGLGSDLNGNLYIGDDNTGGIYKVNCHGGTVANNGVLWNDGIENGLTNIGSIDNYIITNAHPNGGNGKDIYVLDACSGNFLGSICLNNAGTGGWSADWGLQVFQDGTILVTDGQGWGPDSEKAIWKFTFDPTMINNTNACVDALVVNDYLTSFYDILGITKDDSYLYVLARDGDSNSTLLKINATTGALVQSIAEGGWDGSGYNGAMGIVYAPSSGYLYVSGFEDCIAIVDPTNLSYIGPGNGVIPSGGAPKAISILKECCPSSNNIVIDTLLCESGGLIFLQELTKCNGTICEGIWQEGSSNTGLTYNSCDNSVQITSPTACGTFELNSDGTSSNSKCGAFKMVVNICVQSCCTTPEATISAVPSSCAFVFPTESGYLEISNYTEGDKVNWVEGNDYTNGDPDYANAITIGSTPFQIIDGLQDPSGTADYTVRIFNGASDCYEDFTVTMQESTCPTYNVGNYVWLDEDGDGSQDVGESGIPDVRINLIDNAETIIQSVTTDYNGGYLFRNIFEGDYTIEVDYTTLKPGLSNQTFDSEGPLDHRSMVSIGGANDFNQDFGYNYSPPSDTDNPGNVTGAIGDRIWNDANSNGKQDKGEVGIGGVEVELLIDAGVMAMTTTDASGYYIFDNLPAGFYRVNVDASTLPNTFLTSPTGDPDDDANNESEKILLGPGDVYLNMDFGYVLSSSNDIGSMIFVDENVNGIYDVGELPIQGVTVVLIIDSNGNGSWDDSEFPIGITLSDVNGNYLFSGLSDNNYLVAVTDTDDVIGGMVNTADPDGGANGYASLWLSNQDNLLQNFGYTPVGHTNTEGLIGDLVFLDADSDNYYSVGEMGLEDVKVELFDNNNILLQTTYTNAFGLYLFGGLADGAYIVKVDSSTLPGAASIPNGLTPSVDPDGGNDHESSTNIVNGVHDLNQDFGYKAVSANTLSGTIWNDIDANGTLDEVMPEFVENVTVLLKDGQNNILGRTKTDMAGNYEFIGLPDGDYQIDVTDEEKVLAGYWKSNGSNDGNDNNSQSDIYSVTLSGGIINTTGDFGYYNEGAALGNSIWIDRNGNGIQDSNENGMPLVSVTLSVTYPNGVVVSTEEITDAKGHYGFQNLLLDEDYNTGGGGVMPEFELSVTTPTNFMITSLDVNSNGNDKEDADNPNGVLAMPIQGQKNIVKLVDPNMEISNATYDFGFTMDCSNPVVHYAITNGAISNPGQTTDYFYQDTVQNLATFETHIPSISQNGVIRSIDYCDFGNWSYYYNSSDPDEYLFAIEQGDNVTPIEYIELCVDDNPVDRYVVGSEDATYVMARDWFVRTRNDAPLLDAEGNPTTVNIRFYFPEEEFKEILDQAKAQALIWGTAAPTVSDIYWFKKETFDADTDIDDKGTSLLPFDINGLRNATTSELGVNTNDGTSGMTGNGKNHIQFNGINGFSGGTAAITIFNFPLPVELSNFEANAQDCNVELNWSSHSESNFSHYIVERSFDGIVYELIEELPVLESSTSEKKYTYTDEDISSNVFYRLKMLNLDGSYTYSKIISTNPECMDLPELELYPNPIGTDNEILNIRFNSGEELLSEIVIINAVGSTLLELPIDVNKGMNHLELDIANLPIGVYIVIIRNMNEKISAKQFVKF